jgi:hypothetical protein
MFGPTVAPRIEQRDNLTRNRIDAGQVLALAGIAAVTGKGSGVLGSSLQRAVTI